MTPQAFLISDSLQLSHIQTSKFKTGVLTLSLSVPLTKENTVFNMILPGVLRRGTVRYPDMASLNRRLDELYASCVELRSHRVGKNLLFSVSAELLDECYASDDTQILDGVIDVIAEMLLRPNRTDGTFPDRLVQQEIRFAKDSIRATMNNTRTYASIRCMELMNRDNPDSLTLRECEEMLSQIDSKALTEYYENVLRRSQIRAFYVGSLSPQALTDSLQKHFATWGNAQARPVCFPAAEPSVGYRSVTEEMPVAQGKLAMGFRVGACADGYSNSAFTAIVLNELFGGSAASKLFLNVRERMSLCYHCSSSYHPYSGILTVSAGIESKNREVAESAILQQFEEIRQGSITQTELLAAKASLENSYRQIYDNPFELQSFYGNRALFGWRETVEDCLRRISNVTVEDVVALAKQAICDTVFFIEGTKAVSSFEEEDS